LFDSTKLDPACAAVVAALEGDPFFRAEELMGGTAKLARVGTKSLSMCSLRRRVHVVLSKRT
jgi:hypothetical protein